MSTPSSTYVATFGELHQAGIQCRLEKRERKLRKKLAAEQALLHPHQRQPTQQHQQPFTSFEEELAAAGRAHRLNKLNVKREKQERKIAKKVKATKEANLHVQRNATA